MRKSCIPSPVMSPVGLRVDVAQVTRSTSDVAACGGRMNERK
jgi:hypothetical protein